MIRKRRSTATSLAAKSMELTFAAPLVMAHRLARVTKPAPLVTNRDRRELQRMGSEKVVAFTQSGIDMTFRMFQVNHALALSMMRSFWFPWLTVQRPSNLSKQLQNATFSILGRGISPIHRTVTNNAKRLTRSRQR